MTLTAPDIPAGSASASDQDWNAVASAGMHALRRTVTGVANALLHAKGVTDVAIADVIPARSGDADPQIEGPWIGVDDRARPAVVVTRSPSSGHDVVLRDASGLAALRQVLGELGRALLEPLTEAHVDNFLFRVYSYNTPTFSRRWSVLSPTRPLDGVALRWLRQVAAATHRPPSPDELQRGFIAPLSHLLRCVRLPSSLLDAADVALGRLLEGTWVPSWVVTHGDFSRSRLAPGRAEASWNGLSILDCGGMTQSGYPYLDLLRLAESAHLSNRQLRHELAAHSRILGGAPQDARSYVTTALGSRALLGEHLGGGPCIGAAADDLERLDAILTF